MKKLSELSNKTLDSYATKAKADYQKANDSGDYGRAFKRSLGNMKAQGKKIANTTKDIRKTLNREAVQEPTGKLKDACWKGYTAVGMKMKNGKKVPNCVPKEGVNEKLGKDADAGDYIRDFEKSDAPQFKGKSKEKKRQMAIAAYYGSKKEGVNEKLGKDADATDVRWKDQAIMVNAKNFRNGRPQRVVIDRKNMKNYPAKDGWKEVSPGQKVKKEETMQRFATFIDEKKGHFRSVEQGAGMTKKGVEAFRRENPGSKLQTAVTKKPSEMDPDSKDAKRRKSFCARSKGWTGERGKAARKRWNC